MSRPRKVVLALLALPLALAALVMAAWAIDARAHDGEVVRNTELAGIPIGGAGDATLRAAVADLAGEFPDTPVRIVTDDGLELTTRAGDLGLAIDEEGTIDAAMAVGRGHGSRSPAKWVRSLFDPWQVKVSLAVDATTLDRAVEELEGDRRTDPVEPALEGTPEGVRLVPGEPGRRIDPASVSALLPRELAGLGEPIEVEVQRVVTPPAISDDTVQELADRATEVTSGEVTLLVAGRSVPMDATEFRPLISMTVEGDTPTLTMDAARTRDLTLANIPEGGGNPTGVKFTIGPSGPVPVPGRDAQVCCGDGVGSAVAQGLLEGKREIELPTRTMTAAEGVQWAQGLGVREVIGEFTTNHPCCQPRVDNIHLISDMTRGVLIAPGDTFSVNGFVGKRTPEKGFKSAPVIENGEFKNDYGGGISQYATTLFNAAFFGGLDIPAYKAHSKYIPRYPFGREATLAYPSVDLKIRNNTPHGVVIWPSYTDTSITVQLFSTRYVSGAQTGRSKDGGCGPVTVERTRTWVDGRSAKDTFRANYDCSDT